MSVTMWNKHQKRTCEECGKAFNEVIARKKPNLCSVECIAAQRLKTKGKACQHCGRIFVAAQKSAKFCSVDCIHARSRNERVRKCDHCRNSYDTKGHGKAFCSTSCHAAEKRKRASRNCLCCGKTWYRLTRKKSKYESSKHHNAFCSKRCAKRHLSWECNRKARCEGCGKAAGLAGAKCAGCKVWSRGPDLGQWTKALHRGMKAVRSRWARGCRDEWERRIDGALTSLRKRARTSVGQQLKRKVALSWEECVANACGTTWTYRDEWDRKASNAARNIRGKKRNAEAGVARTVHRTGIQVRFNW